MKFIDLSHENDNFDWDNLNPEICGVILKGTEGAKFKDPAFISHLNLARDKDLYVGEYLFLHPEIPAREQADLYFSRGLDFSHPKTLNPIIDFENISKPITVNGKTYSSCDVYVYYNKISVENNLRLLVNILKEGSKRTNATIYTYNGFWGLTFRSVAFSDTNLWVANYKPSSPKMFGGWKDYALWQFSERGSFASGNDGGDVDWSVLNTNFDIKNL